MDIVFEKMQVGDIPAAVKLFAKLKEERAEVSFAEVLDEEAMREWFNNPSYYLYVAKSNGKLGAVFRCMRGESYKNHSGFLTIAVDPEFRGKHMASSFTRYCLDQLKNEGIQLVRAYIYSDNIPSINTVLKCGFTLSGNVYKHHYKEDKGYYVDDLIFHKEL
ncbi:GNAT family N-acetyltransferase [Alkaliphilus serpentinus]|uniref:GNAT family N-acetyltransferase n=1 Tax=Alkaliphilus serpentinus TaxID=1482731 RepID=A0A833HN62_9FIRM|nr:GNAT family N-acetyltransferase [Alkaliphilus serpentinus]KAB3529225.1 GNAT family N-acetyltransferase [Alkaliphilus serpentinus]